MIYEDINCESIYTEFVKSAKRIGSALANIFWIIGYYISYVFITLCITLINKDKEEIKNLLKNSLIFILYERVTLLILLLPIIVCIIGAYLLTNYKRTL